MRALASEFTLLKIKKLASVVVPETGQGVTTDFDGLFRLEVARLLRECCHSISTREVVKRLEITTLHISQVEMQRFSL